MRSLILKLLALIAYMAMPFTMSVAMSAPPAPSHHEMMAMHGMDGTHHGPEQSAPAIDHTAFIGCGMMCAALPAADLAGPAALMLDAEAPAALPVCHFTGILLEIATPPPRLV